NDPPGTMVMPLRGTPSRWGLWPGVRSGRGRLTFLGGGDVSSLFPGEHGRGLAFQVEVGLAADVDHDPVDGAAGEPVRRAARVVAGDGGAAVASDAQALAGELEVTGLGLDATLADFAVPVEERQDAG